MKLLLPLSLSLLLATPVFAHNHQGEKAVIEAQAGVDLAALDAAIASPLRSEANKARDAARHPKETLSFIGVTPSSHVIEITPGGGAWYAEIVAPYVQKGGSYTAAVMDPAKAPNERSREYLTNDNHKLRERLADPGFGKTEIREFDRNAPVFGPAGSADVVLTFRNIHGWVNGGFDQAMFKAFFEVLKPGGVLGLEQHRAREGADVKTTAPGGYVPEAYVIELAKNAGFELAGRSEINANPKDTRDHPNGVWTLPPTLNVGEGGDKAKYEAIGESDRMTLRFVKPKA
jgi:predicted methyltransferase